MRKLFLCFVIAVLLTVLRAGDERLCPANQIFNGQCFELCSSDKFTRCTNVLSKDSNCALLASGKKRFQNNACFACKRIDVVGVRAGACKEEQRPGPTPPPFPTTCPSVPCSRNQRCVFGKCIPIDPDYCGSDNDCDNFETCIRNKCKDRCLTIRCQNGLQCVKGRCVQTRPECKYDYHCPSGFSCEKGKCVNKCKEILCIPQSRCIDGVCVPTCINPCRPGTYCVNNICVPIPNYCNTQRDCKRSQICHLNRCVNFCSVTDCPSGTICQINQCVPKQICRSNQDCPYGQKCKQGVCIDNCLGVTCPQFSKCTNGACYPIDGYCYLPQHCPVGFICSSGRCRDKCSVMSCAPGFHCLNGTCIFDPQCTYDYQCPQGFKCLNTQCVDKCTGVSCPPRYICQQGNCINANPCASIFCPSGTSCVDGACKTIYPNCVDQSDCQNFEYCLQNKCVDRCVSIRCKQNFICEKGRCIDLCSKISCPIGSSCSSGKCIPTATYCRRDSDCKDSEFCKRGICVDKCSQIVCPEGSSCDDGQCKLEIDTCPADSQYEINMCTNPRPSHRACPDIVHVIAPSFSKCGIKSDGSRQNYYRSCEACMDPDVVYYFDVPCHQAPLVCQKEQQCLDYYCSSKFCRTNQQCPFDWQSCANGQCVDRCNFLKCAHCKYGQCGYVAPYGNCRRDNDCERQNWSCFQWKCVDLCWNIRCPANHFCKKGECIRNPK